MPSAGLLTRTGQELVLGLGHRLGLGLWVVLGLARARTGMGLRLA